MNRTHLLIAALTAAGLTGCHQSSAPPAVAAGPAVMAAATETTTSTDSAPETRPSEGEAVAPEPAPLADGGTFPFPGDAGGSALAKALPPAVPPAMPVANPVAPRDRTLPAFLKVPAPPLPDAASAPPRLALPPGKAVRPSPLADPVPLDLGGLVPDLPARAEPPVGPLTRTDRRDVSEPADLPLLSAKPVTNRAPLTDPTSEFTATSVVRDKLPLRATPADFVRIDLPDPFENAAAARPRTPVVEDPNRALGNPPPPRAP